MFVDLPPEMLRNSKYIRFNQKNYLFLEAVRLFVLFSFFFTWAQPSAVAGTHAKEREIHQDLTYHLSEDLFNNAHFPFHLPFQSTQAPNESEVPGETENEYNPDDDWSPLTWKHSTEGIFNISASLKNCFSQTIQSLQNRSTVPLFILYLSWKSFLL